MKLLTALTVFSFLLLFPLAFSVQAAPARIALVIGNGDYEHAPLKNPVNDAALMARTLKSVGFEVMKYENLDRRNLKRAFLRFRDRIREAGKNTVSLVYYAGHGAQVRGDNYLIPIASLVEDEDDVDIEGVSASSLMRILGEARADLNIVILDACRNNPFKTSYRSVQRGLAKMDAPTGTLLAYSTAPGQVAEDGSGENSIYTKALSLAMHKPGATIEQVFKRVRIEVMSRTSDEQVPWESSSLVGDFYFSRGDPTVQATTIVTTAPVVDKEVVFWQSIENSENKADFEAYLRVYPIGAFEVLARNRLKTMTQTQTSALSPPKTEEVAIQDRLIPLAQRVDITTVPEGFFPKYADRQAYAEQKVQQLGNSPSYFKDKPEEIAEALAYLEFMIDKITRPTNHQIGAEERQKYMDLRKNMRSKIGIDENASPSVVIATLYTVGKVDPETLELMIAGRVLGVAKDDISAILEKQGLSSADVLSLTAVFDTAGFDVESVFSVGDAISNIVGAGLDIGLVDSLVDTLDLEASTSFSDAVAAYNAAMGTSLSVEQAREELGIGEDQAPDTR